MRGASIQIGLGAVVAGLAGFAWGGVAFFSLLVFAGLVVLSWGVYDDFVKPRFRVEHRLTAWLLRRGWGVRIESKPQFNFVLHITAPDSEKEILVTRDKDALDDVLAFTARIGLDPRWLAALFAMSNEQRSLLMQEITIYITAKDLGIALNDPRIPGSPITWPPDVKIQTALPQDHTLSQHLVDMTAKKVEATMMGVRALIRRAILEFTAPSSGGERTGVDSPETPQPSPEGQ